LKATLEAVRARMSVEGVAPLLSELSADLGVSRVAVHKRLRRLQTLGLVDWNEGRARSLKLSSKKTDRFLSF
jgi:Mn-dependent DtxR family transcriptional regulator